MSANRILKVAFICASTLLFGAWIASPILAEDHQKTTNEQSGKYQTNKDVRAAMVEIRKIVTDNHSLVTHRRMPVIRAQNMAKRVLRLIEELRNNAEIDKGAQEALEKILKDVELGVRGVAKIDKTINPIDGIVLMDEALSKYAKRFEHPGWKGIREL